MTHEQRGSSFRGARTSFRSQILESKQKAFERLVSQGVPEQEAARIAGGASPTALAVAAEQGRLSGFQRFFGRDRLGQQIPIEEALESSGEFQSLSQEAQQQIRNQAELQNRLESLQQQLAQADRRRDLGTIGREREKERIQREYQQAQSDLIQIERQAATTREAQRRVVGKTIAERIAAGGAGEVIRDPQGRTFIVTKQTVGGKERTVRQQVVGVRAPTAEVGGREFVTPSEAPRFGSRRQASASQAQVTVPLAQLPPRQSQITETTRQRRSFGVSGSFANNGTQQGLIPIANLQFPKTQQPESPAFQAFGTGAVLGAPVGGLPGALVGGAIALTAFGAGELVVGKAEKKVREIEERHGRRQELLNEEVRRLNDETNKFNIEGGDFLRGSALANKARALEERQKKIDERREKELKELTATEKIKTAQFAVPTQKIGLTKEPVTIPIARTAIETGVVLGAGLLAKTAGTEKGQRFISNVREKIAPLEIKEGQFSIRETKAPQKQTFVETMDLIKVERELPGKVSERRIDTAVTAQRKIFGKLPIGKKQQIDISSEQFVIQPTKKTVLILEQSSITGEGISATAEARIFGKQVKGKEPLSGKKLILGGQVQVQTPAERFSSLIKGQVAEKRKTLTTVDPITGGTQKKETTFGAFEFLERPTAQIPSRPKLPPPRPKGETVLESQQRSEGLQRAKLQFIRQPPEGTDFKKRVIGRFTELPESEKGITDIFGTFEIGKPLSAKKPTGKPPQKPLTGRELKKMFSEEPLKSTDVSAPTASQKFQVKLKEQFQRIPSLVGLGLNKAILSQKPIVLPKTIKVPPLRIAPRKEQISRPITTKKAFIHEPEDLIFSGRPENRAIGISRIESRTSQVGQRNLQRPITTQGISALQKQFQAQPQVQRQPFLSAQAEGQIQPSPQVEKQLQRQLQRQRPSPSRFAQGFSAPPFSARRLRIPFLPFLPSLDFDEEARRRRKVRSVGPQFKPSIIGSFLKIKEPKGLQKRVLSGLEVRGITGKEPFFKTRKATSVVFSSRKTIGGIGRL